jgi:hypothetical protein
MDISGAEFREISVTIFIVKTKKCCTNDAILDRKCDQAICSCQISIIYDILQ